MAKIYVFDAWRKFWDGMCTRWSEQGHDVKRGIYWGPELVEWADVCVFHPVQDNLKQASLRQEKPRGTLIAAEAVDIDIYSKHLGGVDWSYVDELVFMGEHMREFANEEYDKHIGGTPQHTIPGGVDLRAFTLQKKREPGYNVAWVGRLWIAKNVFGALQIFNQLLQVDSDNPWHLWLRGDKYHPPHWWRRHCEAYLDANPLLKGRVTFTPIVEDMNVWYEDKDYLLQTSFKEAMGYVVLEALAKGIRPVIQMTTGADAIWPSDLIFQTHAEAIDMLLGGKEDPAAYRQMVINRGYTLADRLKAWNEVLGL